MQAKALGVLVANTQRALNDNEQAERVKSFEKDLIMDLNNILTKFYWLKERKQRHHEEVTSEQVNTMVDFAYWVESLTGKVGFVSEYFQKSPTFAEKVDKDMQELEAYIKANLKKFDQALEETQDNLTTHLNKYASRFISNVLRFLQGRRFGITKRSNIEPLKERIRGIREDSSMPTDNCSDDTLESVSCGLNINETQRNEKLNHQVYSKV